MTASARAMAPTHCCPSLSAHGCLLLLREGASPVHWASQGWSCLGLYIHLPDLKMSIHPATTPRYLDREENCAALMALVKQQQQVLSDLEQEQVRLA